jgi:hypothetical protein
VLAASSYKAKFTMVGSTTTQTISTIRIRICLVSKVTYIYSLVGSWHFDMEIHLTNRIWYSVLPTESRMNSYLGWRAYQTTETLSNDPNPRGIDSIAAGRCGTVSHDTPSGTRRSKICWMVSSNTSSLVGATDALQVVLPERMVTGAALFAACFVRMKPNGFLKAALVSGVALSFFLVVNKIFELRYCGFGRYLTLTQLSLCPSIANITIPGARFRSTIWPTQWHIEDTPTEACTDYRSGLSVCSYTRHCGSIFC